MPHPNVRAQNHALRLPAYTVAPDPNLVFEKVNNNGGIVLISPETLNENGQPA